MRNIVNSDSEGFSHYVMVYSAVLADLVSPSQKLFDCPRFLFKCKLWVKVCVVTSSMLLLF